MNIRLIANLPPLFISVISFDYTVVQIYNLYCTKYEIHLQKCETSDHTVLNSFDIH